MIGEGWEFQPLQTPFWLLLFTVIVWVATGWVSYSNWERRRGKGVAALELLRFIVMGMILFTICKPEFLRTTQIEEQPEVVILTDVTRSMETRDVIMGARDVVKREGWIKSRIKTNFWESLENQAKVSVQDFGMSLTNAEMSIADGTDIYDALDSQRAKRKNLKAVLMISNWSA